MKAIATKYIGPRGLRPGRIKATDLDGNSASIDYPHDAREDQKHFLAAKALCEKMGWHGTLIEGGLGKVQNKVYVWSDGPHYTV